MNNPYEAPQAPLLDAASVSLAPRSFGGIPRMPFVGIIVAIVVISNFLPIILATNSSSMAMVKGLKILMFACYLAAVYFRIKNIGMSLWWILLMIVPIANLLLLLRCFAFQEGYTEVGKLDPAGRMIMYSLIVLVVLLVVIFFLTPLRFAT